MSSFNRPKMNVYTWVSADGRSIHVESMVPEHLKNAINLLRRSVTFEAKLAEGVEYTVFDTDAFLIKVCPPYVRMLRRARELNLFGTDATLEYKESSLKKQAALKRKLDKLNKEREEKLRQATNRLNNSKFVYGETIRNSHEAARQCVRDQNIVNTLKVPITELPEAKKKDIQNGR